MSNELKLRRGTAAQHATFTGAQGEVTVQTDTGAIVTHDGIKVGGFAGGGFKQPAAGAVARSVADKLGDVINVKDFGAVGDGVTDDTAAIRAAVLAANAINVPITIPSGVYFLNSRGGIPIKVSMYCEGAVFKFGPGAFASPLTPMFIVQSENAYETIPVSVGDLKKYATNLPSVLAARRPNGSEYYNGYVFFSSNIRMGKRGENTFTPFLTRTVTVTKGEANGSDLIPVPLVTSVVSVVAAGVTYVSGTDYSFISNFNGDQVFISWSPAGAEPAAGASYTVTYQTHNFLTQGEPNYLSKKGVLDVPLHFDYTSAIRTKTAPIVKGAANGQDTLPPSPYVTGLTSIRQGATTYVLGVDYTYSNGIIDWSLGGAEPAVGSTYNVSYTYNATVDNTPLQVTMTFLQDDLKPLMFVGGGVDLNGQNRATLFNVKRSNVKFESWAVRDTANTPDLNEAKVFTVDNANNIAFEDFYGDSMLQAAPGADSFSYLFNVNFAYNISYKNIKCGGGWGAFQQSSATQVRIQDSVIDRFDGHDNVYDMSVDNCDFYRDVHVGSGGGYMRVTNSRKFFKDFKQFHQVDNPTTEQNITTAIVSMRTDYGGYFNGDITIHNVKCVVSDDVLTGNTFFGVAFYGSGDVMLEDPVFFGQNIYVRDVIVEAPEKFYSSLTNNFRVMHINGGTYTVGRRPGTVLPNEIDISGVKYASALDRQITTLQVQNAIFSFSTPSPVVTDALLLHPDLSGLTLNASATSYMVGGNRRGRQAVDMQPTRVQDTQVASGTLSFLGGGNANTASGLNSAVPGGLNNIADGQYAFIPGGRDATSRGRYACLAWAGKSISGVAGANQVAAMSLGSLTTNSATQRLVADAATTATGTTATQLSLPTNTVANFRAMVTARNTANNDVKSWTVTGTIKNTNGTTSLVGTPTITTIAQDTNAAAWAIAVSADNTLDVLAIDVTGAAATSIRWHAMVEASEVA